MAEQSPPVLMVRPRRLMVIVVLFTVALCALTVVFWIALPAEVQVLFTLSQRLTLLGLLATLVLVIVAAAASYVRADAKGLRIRNGFRVHTVPWGRVHKILLRRGDPWGLLLLTPEDGRPFEVDLDAEKRQLMGVQTVDRPGADEVILDLRRRLDRYRAGPAPAGPEDDRG